MTTKQIKTVKALKDYFKYLKTRILYIRLGLVVVGDNEFKRLTTSYQKYLQAFKLQEFKRWLLQQKHHQENKLDETFYPYAEQLKKDILEVEK